jgi:cell division protein YceG involved in septum cleavage
VIVPPGTGFSTLLSLIGVDTSDIRSRLYKKGFTTDFTLKAGTYAITPGVTLEEALRTSLLKPVHTDLTITLLPGWNKYDIDAYLAGLGISKAGDLIDSRISEYPNLIKEFPFIASLSSLEGLIFPDTFRVKQ